MEVNLSIEAFELTREGIKASLEMMQEMFDESSDEEVAANAAVAVKALRLVLQLKELADA